MKKDIRQRTADSSTKKRNNTGTSTFTPLRVIRAGEKGCRKNKEASGALEGKVLFVAYRSNKPDRHKKEGSRLLLKDLTSATLNSRPQILNFKGGENMRNSERISLNHIQTMILTGILTIGMLILMTMPQVTGTIHAQSYSSHTGWYHGMASIAEQEIRENIQKAEKTDDLNMAASIVVANDEKVDPKNVKKTAEAEKTSSLER